MWSSKIYRRSLVHWLYGPRSNLASFRINFQTSLSLFFSNPKHPYSADHFNIVRPSTFLAFRRIFFLLEYSQTLFFFHLLSSGFLPTFPNNLHTPDLEFCLTKLWKWYYSPRLSHKFLTDLILFQLFRILFYFWQLYARHLSISLIRRKNHEGITVCLLYKRF